MILSKTVLWSLLLILPVLCDMDDHIILSGTVNQNRFLQRELPVEDVAVCVKKARAPSLKDKHLSILACFRSTIFNCLGKRLLEDKTVTRYVKHLYCGAIISKNTHQITPHQYSRILYIDVIQGFIINSDFHIFDFEWHPNFFNHGLSFSASTRKYPPFYRGRRLPWKVFVPDNKATIYISTLPYMKYKLSLSYIRYKFKWLIDNCVVDHQLMERRYVAFSTLSSLRKASDYNVNVASIKYHVIGKSLGKLMVYFSSERKSNTHITLHDGPGHKARPILSLHCMITCNYGIQASTFIAYIIIENHTYENATNVLVRLYEGDHSYRKCKTRNNRGVIEEVSNSEINTVCAIQYGVLYNSVELLVDYFEFVGPTAVVPDYSKDHCQYGGYLFNLKAKIRLCENMYKQTLYVGSDKSMSGLLVWFKGYSRGVFRGRFVKTNCVSNYIGLTSDNVETTEIDDSIPCQTFICSPFSSREGRKCKFNVRGQSGRPIGSSLILIGYLESLFVCFPSADHTHSPTYNITTWFKREWPFGKTQKRKATYSANHQRQLSYEYLISGFISMPVFCDSTNDQFAVGLRITACQFIPEINLNVGSKFGSGMQMMSIDCYDVEFRIGRSDIPHINYVEDNTTTYPAAIIDTSYIGSCPVKCRNFTYVVNILNNIKNIVVEREANVGQAVFTGFQFHGLRVDIKAPKICSWNSDCLIEVVFKMVDAEVGVALPHTWTLNSMTYHFHSRR